MPDSSNQCLVCDASVEDDRHGNLVKQEGGLRLRVERLLGRSVRRSPRCLSLCAACEGALETIEEYYRQVARMRQTYLATAAKYGEQVGPASPGGHQTRLLEDVQEEVSDPGATPSQSTWTICLQASDGSLLPLQQGTPLVMAEDQQVVLETVTVESSETTQATAGEEGAANDASDTYIEPEATSEGLHPSIIDHTGMALPEAATTDPPREEREAPSTVKDEELPPPPFMKPLFTCARCNEQYASPDDLLAHERAECHAGGYNYKCGICGNLYARLDSLRDHMCRHTGERPHQCNLCGEAFSFRNQLSRHRSTHYQNHQHLLGAPDKPTAAAAEMASSAAPAGFMLDGAGTDSKRAEPRGGEEEGGGVGGGGEDNTQQLSSSTSHNNNSSDVIHKEISAEIQNFLASSEEFQLVRTSSGEMHFIQPPGSATTAAAAAERGPQQQQPVSSSQAPSSSSSYVECPKCKEYVLRASLHRHQCPALSAGGEEGAGSFSCPKCGAFYIKRSLLERHKCPALFLEHFPGGRDLSIVETEEISSTSDQYISKISSNLQLMTELAADSSSSTPAAVIPAAGEQEDGAPRSPTTSSSRLVESTVNESKERSATSPGDHHAQLTVTSEVETTDATAGEDSRSHKVMTKVTDGLNVASDTEVDKDASCMSEVVNRGTNVEDGNAAATAAATAAGGEEQEVGDILSQAAGVIHGVKSAPAVAVRRSLLPVRRSKRMAGKVNPLLSLIRRAEEEENSDEEEEEGEEEGEEDYQEPTEREGRKVEVDVTKAEDRAPSGEKEEEEEVVVVVKRKRGRPRKYPIAQVQAAPVMKTPQTSQPASGVDGGEPSPPTKRKRGRPRKIRPAETSAGPAEEAASSKKEESAAGEGNPTPVTNGEVVVTRKRGRTSDVPAEAADGETVVETGERPTDTSSSVNGGGGDTGLTVETPKRKRGRPRKSDVVVVARTGPVAGNRKEDDDGSVHIKQEEGEKENRLRRKRTRPKRYSIEQSGSETDTPEDSGEEEEAAAAREKDAADDDDDDEEFVCKTEVDPSDLGEGRKPRSAPPPKRRFIKNKTSFFCEKCERYFSCQVALDKHKTTPLHKRGLNTPANRKFVCKDCGRGFMKLEHLKDHSVNHTSELPHACVVCKKRFKFRSQLALHKNSAHDSRELAEALRKNPHFATRRRYRNSHLPPGEEKFDPKYEPEILNGLDGGGGPGGGGGGGNEKDVMYRCKVCQQLFSEVRLFNRHIISHFTVKPFKCDICAKEFARADTLRVHQKVHYGFEQHEAGAAGNLLCDTCGRQFKRLDALRNHVKMHYDQRPWKCEHCHKSFTDKHTLGRHLLIHQAQKPWLCATCGKGFNRRTHLDAHEAQHSGRTLYSCEICQRGFSDQGNLGRHMLVHSEARPWVCSICGDRFKRKGNLDEHQQTHNAERQAVCDVCGARFTTKRYLRIHQLIHSGDRPHKCTVCDATFRQLSALITHRRIHTGDTPYKCTHCEKQFKYYDQWKAHEYGHTDAKPYKCMLCSATYRQAGSLRQHRKSVHGNQKFFLCTLCNKTFSTMSLERHIKKVHGSQVTLHNLEEDATTTTTTGTTSSPQVSTTNKTPSIVHITNAQGAIETIELTTLSEEGGTPANIVQLLSGGQTLGGLHTTEQVAMAAAAAAAQGGSVQLADGRQIVQLIGSLTDDDGSGGGGGGAQVLEVSGTDGSQVISIDSIASIHDQDQDDGSVATTTTTAAAAGGGETTLQYDPGSGQPTVVQITSAQAFAEAVSQMNPAAAAATDDDDDDEAAETIPEPMESGEATDSKHLTESQTLTVDTSTTLVVEVDLPQGDLATIQQQMTVPSTSLVPMDIVSAETTVTTLKPSQQDGLPSLESSEAVQGIQEKTDIMADAVTEIGQQDVIETVSIATTYEPSPDV